MNKKILSIPSRRIDLPNANLPRAWTGLKAIKPQGDHLGDELKGEGGDSNFDQGFN